MRTLISITFPQGFQISKNFGHSTLESGGKKTFKRYLKKWTDKHTNTRTDKWTTYRKHRSRGPMIWKQQQQRSFKLVTYEVTLFRNLCFLATFMTVIDVWKMLFNTICVDSPWEIFFYHVFWNRVTLKLYLANWRQNHNLSFLNRAVGLILELHYIDTDKKQG